MPEDEGSYHQIVSLGTMLHALLGDKIYKMVRLDNQTLIVGIVESLVYSKVFEVTKQTCNVGTIIVLCEI